MLSSKWKNMSKLKITADGALCEYTSLPLTHITRVCPLPTLLPVHSYTQSGTMSCVQHSCLRLYTLSLLHSHVRRWDELNRTMMMSASMRFSLKVLCSAPAASALYCLCNFPHRFYVCRKLNLEFGLFNSLQLPAPNMIFSTFMLLTFYVDFFIFVHQLC